MSEPLLPQINRLGAAQGLRPAQKAASDGVGDEFAAMMKSQLRKVGAMQSEADQNVQRLITGESQNMTEVFVAARKAQVAFSLLMEIRNKMIDAYQEIKNLRV